MRRRPGAPTKQKSHRFHAAPHVSQAGPSAGRAHKNKNNKQTSSHTCRQGAEKKSNRVLLCSTTKRNPRTPPHAWLRSILPLGVYSALTEDLAFHLTTRTHWMDLYSALMEYQRSTTFSTKKTQPQNPLQPSLQPSLPNLLYAELNYPSLKSKLIFLPLDLYSSLMEYQTCTTLLYKKTQPFLHNYFFTTKLNFQILPQIDPTSRPVLRTDGVLGLPYLFSPEKRNQNKPMDLYSASMQYQRHTTFSNTPQSAHCPPRLRSILPLGLYSALMEYQAFHDPQLWGADALRLWSLVRLSDSIIMGAPQPHIRHRTISRLAHAPRLVRVLVTLRRAFNE